MAGRADVAGARVRDAELLVRSEAGFAAEVAGRVVALAVRSAHGPKDLFARGRAGARGLAEAVDVAVEGTLQCPARVEALRARASVDNTDGAVRAACLHPEQTLVRVGAAVRAAHRPEVARAGAVAAADRVPLLVQLAHLGSWTLDTLARICVTDDMGAFCEAARSCYTVVSVGNDNILLIRFLLLY